ncbi:MAG TPA: hypothetical protein VFQ76_09960 [Longimicrobiaceae bacterium]|nr:hypothetical protein [Longimicrobiaceae bacterium]
MQRPTRKVFRGVFNALMLGALGLGATQALASPAAPAAAYCTREEAAECNWACQEALGPSYRGRCTKTSIGTVSCQCVQVILPGAR